MGEGNTPVVQSVRIGPQSGLRLFFKMELCNPSGSYKDRFAAAEASHLLQRKVQACVATSSGNTGAALAAYCARYGIACAIFVNEYAPAGKLRQMQKLGARIFRVRDFVTSPDVTQSVYRRLQQMAAENSIPVVVSAYRYCPEGMRGVEKIGAELIAQCQDGIDHIFVPVGGGGLFTAICRGMGTARGFRTKIHAVQPEGCATVVSAFEDGRGEILPVTSTTCISGLAVPFDMDASVCLAELRKSGGHGIAVPDREVFAAQLQMMREEGIWCEPAGAAALAGCLRARERGWVGRGESAVCIVSGHGFKDPASLLSAADERPLAVIEEREISGRLLEVNG
jgi:threonine synthase